MQKKKKKKKKNREINLEYFVRFIGRSVDFTEFFVKKFWE